MLIDTNKRYPNEWFLSNYKKWTSRESDFTNTELCQNYGQIEKRYIKDVDGYRDEVACLNGIGV